MQPPPRPKDEIERLAVLDQYRVLDSPPEQSYDDLVLLASQICQTPIALISLVDRDRQWFKARVGLGAPQTGRDVSFFGHAIGGSELFVVNDATKDSRFNDNPLVTGEPRVIFYAGSPLITPEGKRIGTLCVIDHSRRDLDAGQKVALSALARQAVQLLEHRKNSFEIDEQRAKLVSTAKLAALGEMAAGIAHEINNPLAIIGAKVELLQRKCSVQEMNPNEFRKELEKIESTVGRIGKIIRGLRLFSRSGEGDPLVSESLANIIEAIVGLCGEKFKSQGIALKVGTIDQDLFVKCRPHQITQILVNLLNNAFDATRSVEHGVIRVSTVAENGTIRVAVCDNGTGIAEEIREKVMEPFFTTKPVGLGTGLGLSISHGIAVAHGGDLKLDSSADETRFVLSLPLDSAKIKTKSA